MPVGLRERRSAELRLGIRNSMKTRLQRSGALLYYGLLAWLKKRICYTLLCCLRQLARLKDQRRLKAQTTTLRPKKILSKDSPEKGAHTCLNSPQPLAVQLVNLQLIQPHQPSNTNLPCYVIQMAKALTFMQL